MPMVALSYPSANRWREASGPPVKIMDSLPLRLQAAWTRRMASWTSGASNSPGRPRAMDRSKGPTKMPSTPSMAVISSMCSRQPTVSHWGSSSVSWLQVSM